MDMQNPRRGDGTGCEIHRADEVSEPTSTTQNNQPATLESLAPPDISNLHMGGRASVQLKAPNSGAVSSSDCDVQKDDNRIFYCLPVKALRDKDLTSLDHRVLGAIALHDGMSLYKKKGRGCYARHKTLRDIVGCDYTNISKSIKKLVKSGYLVVTAHPKDKRRSIYRVIYASPDGCSFDQVQSANSEDETTNNLCKVVGKGSSEKLGKTANPSTHYIPLNGKKESARRSNNTSSFWEPDDFLSNLPSRKPERVGPINPNTVLDQNILVLLSKVERDLQNRCSEIDPNAWHQWLTNVAATESDLSFDGESASDWAKRLLNDPFLIETVNQQADQNAAHCGMENA